MNDETNLQLLCELLAHIDDKLNKLPVKQQEDILFSAQSSMSRKLTDWWEAQTRAGREHERLMKQAIKDEKERKKILAKLTRREKELLRLE